MRERHDNAHARGSFLDLEVADARHIRTSNEALARCPRKHKAAGVGERHTDLVVAVAAGMAAHIRPAAARTGSALVAADCRRGVVLFVG